MQSYAYVIGCVVLITYRFPSLVSTRCQQVPCCAQRQVTARLGILGNGKKTICDLLQCGCKCLIAVCCNHQRNRQRRIPVSLRRSQ